MSVFVDGSYVSLVDHGENFGYLLNENDSFASVDFRVLQGRNDDRFAKAIKLLHNGKIEIFYDVRDYVPFTSQMRLLRTDTIIQFVCDVFGGIIDSRDDGFLSCQNIDISRERIYIEPATSKPKLIYVPISERVFNSFSEFEEMLRRNITREISGEIKKTDDKLEKFLEDVSSSLISIDELYRKYHTERSTAGSGADKTSSGKIGINDININNTNKNNMNISKCRLIPDNPDYPCIELTDALIRIGNGKDLEWADIVIRAEGISRKQCSIRKIGEEFFISDGCEERPSTNHTYIGNLRLDHLKLYKLTVGDRIKMAGITYTIG